MSDRAQTRLLTVLTIVVFEIVKGPLSNILLAEKVPGNRGPSEDVVDALVAQLVDGLDTDWIEDLLESVNRKIRDEVPEVTHTFIDLHAAGRRAERR